jgi:MFS superfamily sulfate permease-like transporter
MISRQILEIIFGFKLIISILSIVLIILFFTAYFTCSLRNYFIGCSPLMFIVLFTAGAWIRSLHHLKTARNLEVVKEVLDD